VAAATPVAEKIDSLLTRYAEYGFWGTVLVSRGGQPILNKGYGWADAEKRVSSNPATLYDAGSLAKTFTAAALLDLEARGKLAVTDPISNYLPGLPADKGAITIHHLLTHTSGYPLDAADIGVTAADDTEQLLAKAGSAKLLHPPGTAYEYSNVGYGLLAHIIEKVSGRSWQRHVRQRLLKRAGLENTYLWGEPLPRKAQLAQGYIGSSEEEMKAEPLLVRDGRSPLLWRKYLLGSGGVFGSVGDLNRWWCALRGKKLLPEAQRRKIFAVQAANQGYGWNIAQTDGRLTRIHRGGLRGSYQTLVAYYPERNDLLVYGINKNVSNNWASLVWRNAERLLQGEKVALPPPTTQIDDEATTRLAGAYRLATGGSLAFRKVGGAFYFGAEGQDALDPVEYEGRAKPELRERLHKASLDLVAALSRKDRSTAERIAATGASNFAKLAGQWENWSQQIGARSDAQLLGSAPGAQQHTRVFLRLKGKNGALVIRLLWDPAKMSLLAWGDDIPLPAYTRLWPQSESRFVSYDFGTGRTRHYTFDGEGGVKVGSETNQTLVTGVKEN
jgi:CubicO group peptidase (beta-lactamase class C family)